MVDVDLMVELGAGSDPLSFMFRLSGDQLRVYISSWIYVVFIPSIRPLSFVWIFFYDV